MKGLNVHMSVSRATVGGGASLVCRVLSKRWTVSAASTAIPPSSWSPNFPYEDDVRVHPQVASQGLREA